jgi:outer membrane protein assembly factor BamB
MGMGLVRTGGRRLPIVTTVLALLVSSGCWLQIGAGGGHTRYNPVETALTTETVGDLHEVWSVAVAGGATEAMVSKGRVFVSWSGSNSAGVRAFALADGAPLWNRALVSVPSVPGSVAGTAPVTFVGDQLWTGHLGFVPMSPRPGGPACVSGTDILDPATGAGGGSGDMTSAVASADGLIARTILRLGPTCSPTIMLEVRGSVPTWTSAPFGISSGNFAPTLAGGQVLVTHGTVLDAYAAAGCGAAVCSPTWSVPFPDGASDAVAGSTGPVFLTSAGNLLALDRATGAELWTMPLGPPGEISSGGVALAEGTVYVVAGPADGSPSLRAVDAAGCGAATCSPEWTATLPGTGPRAPVVGADVVYTSTSAGVHAFDTAGCGAATCSPLTSVAAPGGVLSVAQGHVLVAAHTRLVALGLGPGPGPG